MQNTGKRSNWFSAAFSVSESGRNPIDPQRLKDANWTLSEVMEMELEKTAECLQIIEAVGAAVEATLQSRGLPGIGLLPEQVHILSRTDGSLEITGGGPAVSYAGEIYLIEQETAAKTLFIMAHEATHLMAYTTLAIDAENGEAYMERSGFSFADRKKGTKFSVLNEAITEKLATEVRQRTAEALNLDPKKAFQGMSVELASQQLVLAVCRSLVKEGIEKREINLALDRDYLSGSHDFLNILWAKCPETAKLIAGLDRHPEDIADAADSLGFSLLAEAIREIQ